MGKIFLVSGATGFVGSSLTVELIMRGNFVFCLARPKGNLSAQDRLDRSLAFVDPMIQRSRKGYYQVIEGVIYETDLNRGQEHNNSYEYAKMLAEIAVNDSSLVQLEFAAKCNFQAPSFI